MTLAVVAILVGGGWAARHPAQLRAACDRVSAHPLARRLRLRYRRQFGGVERRLHPRLALVLSLTVQFGVLALSGWAFGAVLRFVARDGLVHIDGPITAYVAGHRVAWLTTAMRTASLLGSTPVLVPVALGAGWWLRRRHGGWTAPRIMAGAYLGAVALSHLVKLLVARPRPAVAPIVMTVGGYSFPSGHATHTTAVVGALAYLAAASMSGWRAKVRTWTAAVLVVTLVGFSRVYLGVHWATDVICGAALGALWLTLLLTTMRAFAGPPVANRS